jgi:hypothetical protein
MIILPLLSIRLYYTAKFEALKKKSFYSFIWQKIARCIITIIIIIPVITFMQGMYIYILKQTMFLGYIVLQLFCVYNCVMCNVISNIKYVLCLLLLLFHVNAVSQFKEQTEYNVHDRDFLES